MASISNSTTVSPTLSRALASLHMARSASMYGPPPPRPIPATRLAIRKGSSGLMTVTAASQKGFTDHGAGVWENPQDHSIWYREGSTLRRRNVNIDRMISDYLSTLPKST